MRINTHLLTFTSRGKICLSQKTKTSNLFRNSLYSNNTIYIRSQTLTPLCWPQGQRGDKKRHDKAGIANKPRKKEGKRKQDKKRHPAKCKHKHTNTQTPASYYIRCSPAFPSPAKGLGSRFHARPLLLPPPPPSSIRSFGPK